MSDEKSILEQQKEELIKNLDLNHINYIANKFIDLYKNNEIYGNNDDSTNIT